MKWHVILLKKYRKLLFVFLTLSVYFRATVNFLLHLRQFVQATPTTDSFPNVILLALTASHAGQYTSTPLAYYAPVGNKYWTNFNTTHLNGVPIYSPNPTQYTAVSFCIHKNTELVSLIWTQEHYTSNYDIWSISQPTVTLEQITL